MGEAELSEQTAGAVIACVGVGSHLRELLMSGEGLGEDRSYCFSGEVEAPVVLVNSVAEEGDPMFGTEDKAYETKDPPRTRDRPGGLIRPVTKQHLCYDALRFPFGRGSRLLILRPIRVLRVSEDCRAVRQREWP